MRFLTSSLSSRGMRPVTLPVCCSGVLSSLLTPYAQAHRHTGEAGHQHDPRGVAIRTSQGRSGTTDAEGRVDAGGTALTS